MPDSAAQWFVERGIGEDRALLLEGEEVLAARLYWPGELRPGEVTEAILVSKQAGVRRGVAKTGAGLEILVDRLPPDVTEGQAVSIRITRTPISERGRLKRAHGVVASVGEESLPHSPEGTPVARFPAGLWEEVWSAASSSRIDFAGGSLLFSVTPAMTLIDVDGELPPRELALAAVPAIACGLRWFELGGSIGIDFPTIPDKASRKSVDDALAKALNEWPHERTAMNGFGFVQIVARLEKPSLLHRFNAARVGACARMALRQAERIEGSGRVLLMTVHPALKAKLKPVWIEELARRTGKQVRIEADPGLALEAPNAQLVER